MIKLRERAETLGVVLFFKDTNKITTDNADKLVPLIQACTFL